MTDLATMIAGACLLLALLVTVPWFLLMVLLALFAFKSLVSDLSTVATIAFEISRPIPRWGLNRQS